MVRVVVGSNCVIKNAKSVPDGFMLLSVLLGIGVIYDMKSFECRCQDTNASTVSTVHNFRITKLKRHQKANVDYYELGCSIFELAQMGDKLYKEAKKIEDKRALLMIVFADLSVKNGKLIPTYHNGFQLISACAEKSTGCRRTEWLPVPDQFTTAALLDYVKYPEVLMRDLQRFVAV